MEKTTVQTVLETERLLLKAPDERYAAALCDYYVRNRSFLEPFEATKEDSFFTVSHQRRTILSEIDQRNAGTSYRFYIFLKDDPDAIIGSIGLNNIIRGCFHSCFLGYKLSFDLVNRGYMTEAVKAVCRFAFDSLLLHRIEGNVMPENKASAAVLLKCGFFEEGLSHKYLKINGEWRDHVHMVLLNDRV